MALEMTQRKYGTVGSEKKIYAESKVDMKLRTKQSPDVADAGFILLDLCRQRLGFVAVIMVQGPSGFMHRQKSSWGNLRRKLSAKRNMPRRL